MRSLTFIILAATLTLGASCSTHSVQRGHEREIPVEMFGRPETAPENYDIFPEYRIQGGDVLDILFHFSPGKGDEVFRMLPQDIIEIKFPEMPELNELQQIRPDGTIELPYVGSVEAQNKTPEELRKDLMKRYAAYLKNPHLYVAVREFGGKINELKISITNAARGQSKLIYVRNDGYATFPVVGDLMVTGKTVPEAGAELNDMFHQITKDVRVDLLLHQSIGSRISVLGSVWSSGRYPIERPVSIMEALALAGGPRDDARLVEVYVLRKRGDEVITRKVNVLDIYKAANGAQHVYLSTNDIVYVPRKKLNKAAETMRLISDMLLYNGWDIGDYNTIRGN